MASFSKEFLTGGTANGRPIKVAATATPGTTLHTAHASSKDELWLWATNTDTVDRTLTLEHGGVTAPDDNLKFIVPAGETIPILAGTILSGGLLLKAFASAANVVVCAGFVNRIT